jgi:hypothetical protein
MEEKGYKSFNRTRKAFERHPVWGTVIVVGVIVLILGSLSGSGSSNSSSTFSANAPAGICDTDLAALKEEAYTPDYKKLVKDPEASRGNIATFTGQIVQIQQSGNEGAMRLSVTKASYGWSISDIVLVTYHQATDAVEGDVVTVTGKLTGATTYTSQANFQITVPSVDVCSVETKVSAPAATPKKSGTSSATTPKSNTPPAQTYTTPSGAVVNGNGSTVSAPPPPPASWHTIGTYSGNTTKNTAPFTIRGSQWRITWQESAKGYFGASVETPDNSGSSCQIANIIGPDSDTTYCYGAGTYYLWINGSDPWTMTVEDYY